MEQYKALIEQIRGWQPNREVVRACEDLLCYLASNSNGSVSVLTYRSLADITHLEVLSSSLEVVLTTLSSTYPALELEFRFFSPDGRVENVSKEEKREFIKTGRFSDPSSGKEIPDAAYYMYPYYRPCFEYLLSEAK